MHNETEGRRSEALRQLQARSGSWQLSHPGGGATKVRVRVSEKACLDESGNEVCVLSLLSRDKPLHGVGHKQLHPRLLLLGDLVCFASSH